MYWHTLHLLSLHLGCNPSICNFSVTSSPAHEKNTKYICVTYRGSEYSFDQMGQHLLMVGSKKCCQPDPAPWGGWRGKEVVVQAAHWTRAQDQLWTLPRLGHGRQRRALFPQGSLPSCPQACIHAINLFMPNKGLDCASWLGGQSSHHYRFNHTPSEPLNQTVTVQSGFISNGGNIRKWVVKGHT